MLKVRKNRGYNNKSLKNTAMMRIGNLDTCLNIDVSTFPSRIEPKHVALYTSL